MNWKISTEKIKSYACGNDVRKVSKEPFCSVVNLAIIYPLDNRNCTKNNLQLKQVKKKKNTSQESSYLYARAYLKKSTVKKKKIRRRITKKKQKDKMGIL